MNIIKALIDHYGTDLTEATSLGLELVSVAHVMGVPRPYTSIRARIVSYDDTDDAIDVAFTEQIYHDTGTSRRASAIIDVLLRQTEGISRRDLQNRHNITALDMRLHTDTIALGYVLSESKVDTGKLTPSGRPQLETRLFLTPKV